MDGLGSPSYFQIFQLQNWLFLAWFLVDPLILWWFTHASMNSPCYKKAADSAFKEKALFQQRALTVDRNSLAGNPLICKCYITALC